MKIVTKQVIETELLKQLGKTITPALINNALDAVGEKAVDIIRQRTVSGIDAFGRRFGSYTYNYKLFKRAFVGGGSKGKKKTAKAVSKTIEKLRARGGAYMAKKDTDYLRLTGALFDDITWRKIGTPKQSNGKVIGRIEIYIKKRSELKAQGLQSTTGRTKTSAYSKKAFSFFGVALTGARQQIEATAINDVLLEKLIGGITGKVVIK